MTKFVNRLLDTSRYYINFKKKPGLIFSTKEIDDFYSHDKENDEENDRMLCFNVLTFQNTLLKSFKSFIESGEYGKLLRNPTLQNQ